MKKRHSSFFVMELLLSLGLFSLCAVVCVLLFIRAHLLSQESQQLTQSVTLAQNAAQAVQAQPDPTTLAFLLEGQNQGDTIFCYYDKEGTPCTSQASVYQLTLTIKPKVTEISVFSHEKSIYHLSVSAEEVLT